MFLFAHREKHFLNIYLFFLTCKTSNCEFEEIIILILKCLNKSLISAPISLVLITDLEKKEEVSL